jgi:hypothetical protein
MCWALATRPEKSRKFNATMRRGKCMMSDDLWKVAIDKKGEEIVPLMHQV